MTTLSGLILTDPKTANRDGRADAFRRVRTSFWGSRGQTPRATARRPVAKLLHDVALGGTAASAANNMLKVLATDRRA